MKLIISNYFKGYLPLKKQCDKHTHTSWCLILTKNAELFFTGHTLTIFLCI